MKTILPPMTSAGKRRLRELIEFLKKLPDKSFHFNSTVAEVDEQGCGAVCCAIGWTPKLFPKLVKWRGQEETEVGGEWYGDIAKRLFGIKGDAASDLFCPNCQQDVHPSLKQCGPDSTPAKFADMLESYIALTETPTP